MPLNWAFFGFETPGSVFCLFAGNHANFSFLSLKTFFLLFGIELAVLTFIASKIGFFCFFTDDHLVLSNVKGFSARLQLITLIVAISQWKQCILSFLAKLRCWQRYHTSVFCLFGQNQGVLSFTTPIGLTIISFTQNFSLFVTKLSCFQHYRSENGNSVVCCCYTVISFLALKMFFHLFAAKLCLVLSHQTEVFCLFVANHCNRSFISFKTLLRLFAVEFRCYLGLWRQKPKVLFSVRQS